MGFREREQGTGNREKKKGEKEKRKRKRKRKKGKKGKGKGDLFLDFCNNMVHGLPELLIFFVFDSQLFVSANEFVVLENIQSEWRSYWKTLKKVKRDQPRKGNSRLLKSWNRFSSCRQKLFVRLLRTLKSFQKLIGTFQLGPKLL